MERMKRDTEGRGCCDLECDPFLLVISRLFPVVLGTDAGQMRTTSGTNGERGLGRVGVEAFKCVAVGTTSLTSGNASHSRSAPCCDHQFYHQGPRPPSLPVQGSASCGLGGLR